MKSFRLMCRQIFLSWWCLRKKPFTIKKCKKSSSQIQREEIFMPFWNCHRACKTLKLSRATFPKHPLWKMYFRNAKWFFGINYNGAQKPFEALDRSFQVFRRNIRPFVNVLILLAEVFRQTLPVISRSSAPTGRNKCFSKVHYFVITCKNTNITTNMRL